MLIFKGIGYISSPLTAKCNTNLVYTAESAGVLFIQVCCICITRAGVYIDDLCKSNFCLFVYKINLCHLHTNQITISTNKNNNYFFLTIGFNCLEFPIIFKVISNQRNVLRQFYTVQASVLSLKPVWPAAASFHSAVQWPSPGAHSGAGIPQVPQMFFRVNVFDTFYKCVHVNNKTIWAVNPL